MDFAWNSAAYGNMALKDSIPTPTYTTYGSPTLESTGDKFVNLCRFIELLNAYNTPSGTDNPCLIFFSGRSAEDFAACRPVDTKKFKHTFGVAINGQTGEVSTLTSNIVNVTVSPDGWDDTGLAEMMSNTVMLSSCK